MLTLLSHPVIPYVLPFAVFLFLTELARWVPNSLLWVYPVKTIVAGGLLLWFRKTYSEIKPDFSLLAIAVGVVVFLLWIPRFLLTSFSSSKPSTFLSPSPIILVLLQCPLL